MNFSERLDFLLNSKNIKQADLADSCNFRRGNISDWKRLGTMPTSEIAIKIAKRLDVSLDFLLTGENKEDAGVVLSEDEEELLADYRLLTEAQKSMFSLMLSAVSKHV